MKKNIRMKIHRTRLILLVILTVLCHTAALSVENVSGTVYFPLAKSRIDTIFSSNGYDLNKLAAHIASDSTMNLLGVNIIGGASPEGPIALNDRLSHQRADALRQYLTNHQFSLANKASMTYLGRDWKGLRYIVAADTIIPHKSEVLNILDRYLDADTPDNTLSDLTLRRLKSLDGGSSYQYLLHNIFPALREATVTINFQPQLLPIESPEGEVSLILPPTDITYQLPAISSATPVKRPFYMSLRTNMLYDLLALPSIGAEFYVGRNISVGAEWTYGWWKTDRKHRYWRAYGGNLIVRRWFGRKAEEKPLTGHHIGLYAGIFTYDFEFGGTGYMGGRPGATLWDRSMKTAGIEYGYSLPIAKRLNIDFTIGLGYIGGKYVKYEPKGKGYAWNSTHRLTWFGPTKAEVSLVWLLGHENVNKKKGGIR